MTKKLYRTPVPEGALNSVEPSVQRRLAQSGILSGGTSSENIAGEPGTLRLDGSYMGKHAELLATELRELLQSDLAYIPLYAEDANTTLDEAGYYTAERGDAGRATPQSDKVATFAGQLVRAGTRASQWAAVRTASSTVTNDFGSGTTGYIGVPAAARKVRWVNEQTGNRETVSVVETRAAEFGDIDIIDAEASTFSSPTLIYDLDYADVGDVDAGLWDTYGRSKTDANGNTVWGRVFDAGHDYRGAAVLDTGLLRATFDEANNALTAKWWNNTASAWEPRSLGPIHNPLDSLTNISTGSNATAATVSTPSKDGTAIQGTTDDPATQFSRYISWTPSSAIDLSAAGDIAFWYHTNDKTGINTLRLFDSGGTAETYAYDSQATSGSMEYITVPTSEFTAIDMAAISEVRWKFGDDGSGIDRTITVDRFAGPTTWELYDLDVTQIGQVSHEAVVEFRNPSTSPTMYETLHAIVTRGDKRVQWVRPPDDSTATSAGLVDYLDPIASGSDIDLGARQGLLAREEVSS